MLCYYSVKLCFLNKLFNSRFFFLDRINKIYWIFILIILFILPKNEHLDLLKYIFCLQP